MEENNQNNQLEEKDWKRELAEHFLKCYETGALVDLKFVEQTIHQERKKEREMILEKMRPYTIKAKESERIADFTLKQFESILPSLQPTNNTKEE